MRDLQFAGDFNQPLGALTRPAFHRPRGRVTRSRSRYSSSGMAYLREMPVQSLKAPTLKRAALRPASRWRRLSIAAWWENQVLADANQPLLTDQNLQNRPRAPGLDARFCEDLGNRGHRQAGLLKRPLDGGARLFFVLLSTTLWARRRTISPSAAEVLGLRHERVENESGRFGQVAGRAESCRGFPAITALRGGIRARFKQALARSIEPGAIHQPRLRLPQHDERPGAGGFVQIRFHPAGAGCQVAEAHAEFGFTDQQRIFAATSAPARMSSRSAALSAFSVTHTAGVQHTPPPIVTTGENIRMMKRSPGAASAGSRNTRRA